MSERLVPLSQIRYFSELPMSRHTSHSDHRSDQRRDQDEEPREDQDEDQREDHEAAAADADETPSGRNQLARRHGAPPLPAHHRPGREASLWAAGLGAVAGIAAAAAHFMPQTSDAVASCARRAARRMAEDAVASTVESTINRVRESGAPAPVVQVLEDCATAAGRGLRQRDGDEDGEDDGRVPQRRRLV